MLSQRDGGRGVKSASWREGEWEEGVCTQYTRSQGPGGGGRWVGEGQKAEPPRVQGTKTRNLGGGIRGAVGNPGISGTGTWRASLRDKSGCGGSSSPLWGSPLHPSAQISVPPLTPTPDSLNVTENGSYCEEWGCGPTCVQLLAQGSGEGYPSPCCLSAQYLNIHLY